MKLNDDEILELKIVLLLWQFGECLIWWLANGERI